MGLTTAKDYGAITSVEQLKRLAGQMLDDGKPIGFDTETGYFGKDTKKRSLNHYHENQFTVGFSFSNSDSWARYVPLRHDLGGNIDDVDGAWEAVRDMLEYGHIVSFHQKFERAGVLKAAGIELGKYGKVDDPMLGAYVLGQYYNKSWRTIVDLKALVYEIYEYKMAMIHDLWPDLPQNKYDFIRFNTLEVTPNVVSYACEDALWVIPLYRDICQVAEKENPYMYMLEHKIANMMVEVERYGVTMDWRALEEELARTKTFAPQFEYYVKQELGKMAGRDLSEMNLNSAPQKQKLLFDELGLTTTTVSKITGKMSASKKALPALAKEHSAIQALLDYGEIQNHSRRIKKWLAEYSDNHDRRVHASYNQVQVPGGRFAAGEPAIQQLPKDNFWAVDGTSFDLEKDKAELNIYMAEHENGKDFWYYNFRDFIVAADDHYLLTFDFSQAELRVLAGLTQEPTLLDAFANGDDIHSATASIVFGIPIEEVSKEMRAKGKTQNFALVYGQGPKATAEQLAITMEEAIALNKEYFAKLPYVTSWFNEAKRKGHRDGAVTSIFGRRVPIWELLSDSRAIQSKGDRVIVNSYCQGGVADYVKFIQLQARKALIEAGLWDNGVMMIMNQHDSLTFEVHNRLDPNELRGMLNPIVVLDPEAFRPLNGFPPFVADWEIGQRWGSSAKWDLDKKAVFDGEHWIVEPDAEYESIVITVDEMPTESNWKKFVAALKNNPGSSEVQFHCPQGKLVLPFTSGLTDSRIKDLKSILPDAIITCTEVG